MKINKITFKNRDGVELSGRLELPAAATTQAYALFAHCFTCTKNLKSVHDISAALGQNGIAVFAFDFTGLGESEGDFAETNFSSSVNDLIDAAKFLQSKYRAPAILIGHSLGGTAAIRAALEIPSVLAVATIGAPFCPAHVKNLFADDIGSIRADGETQVHIGGRSFRIRRQFLDDINGQSVESALRNLKRALLVFHSPLDNVVGIENATNIFQAAKHPRSFISLDHADHMLSRTEDSTFTGQLLAAWARRYIRLDELEQQNEFRTEHQVAVRTGESYTTDVLSGNHRLVADEPASVGGNDFGPSPYGYLQAALGSCTAITIRMYANRKEWPLKEVRVHLNHNKVHAKDCADCDTPDGKIDELERHIELIGDLSDEQRGRLLEIADKCPVHKTLHSEIKVRTFLEDRQ